MARVLRGDVFWADLDPARGHEQAGMRPVLVISQVRTLSIERLSQKIGRVASEELTKIIGGLNEIVGD